MRPIFRSTVSFSRSSSAMISASILSSRPSSDSASSSIGFGSGLAPPAVSLATAAFSSSRSRCRVSISAIAASSLRASAGCSCFRAHELRPRPRPPHVPSSVPLMASGPVQLPHLISFREAGGVPLAFCEPESRGPRKPSAGCCGALSLEGRSSLPAGPVLSHGARPGGPRMAWIGRPAGCRLAKRPDLAEQSRV